MFFLFSSLSLGEDYEVMEMNYGKPKEVFVENRIIHKNLSQFCNKCYRLRDSNSSLWPIFQGLNYFIISCFSHKFPSRIPIHWMGIFKNQERFHTHFKKPPSFFVQVSRIERYEGVFETQISRNSPNFPKSDLLFLG